MAEGERLSASGSAESSTPTRHEPPPPAARCGQPLPPPRPRPGRPASRSLSRGPERLRAEPRQPMRFANGKLECSAGAFFAFDTTLGHSKDGKKHAARKAGRCASARGAPSQRGAGPLGAGGQHLNSQSRQSVAGAAAGTRGGMGLGMCVSPGQVVVGGHGYLHEVVSEAREERNCVRTGSVAGGHPGLVEVRRPQSAIRAAAGRSRHPFDPRRCGGTAAQAGSLASAFGMVQWERWICSGSAPEHEILFNWWYFAHGVGIPPLCRRAAHVPRVVASRQARPAERVLADQSLQIWPAIRRPWSASMSWVFIRLQTFLSTAKSFFQLHIDFFDCTPTCHMFDRKAHCENLSVAAPWRNTGDTQPHTLSRDKKLSDTP